MDERELGLTSAADAATTCAQGLLEAAQEAARKTRTWLLSRQHDDGHWCAELEGDTILESEYVLLLAWLGRQHDDAARQAARYLLTRQGGDGGWSLYPGGRSDVSVSVKAYFALKLAGHDPQSLAMLRARAAILRLGGADAVNSFTRFYLALLGQIPFELCPAVPPEMMLLPVWSPINIYRMSAWSRTIFVPLSIVWSYRPVCAVAVEHGIDELFVRPPYAWPPLECPGRGASSGWFSWSRFFRATDAGLKLIERFGLRPLRNRALRLAEQWMLDRFADSDGLGAIFPPIVWSLIALRCRGYGVESAVVRECFKQLEELAIVQDGTLRLQPCKSPVWDTALAVRALASAPDAPESVHRACQRAIGWLTDKEVRQPGDWSMRVAAEPAGWYFEYRNAFYPDVDDTSMVLMALESGAKENATRRDVADERSAEYPTELAAISRRAVQWLLAMQNRDGGWGAFDRDNDCELLCHVPFADHNAMIDPSTPDITARVLESVAPHGLGLGDPVVDRAVHYLRATQEPDGSWFGRWGVNHIYGTWQVLAGLARMGITCDDPLMERGASWLLGCQQPSGGWGESPDSYSDVRSRGRGTATASQTAWALLGLIAVGHRDHPAVRHGVRWLIETQRRDGAWDEPEFTGTGFPLVFYLRYHYYPIYFPLLALHVWQARGNQDSAARSAARSAVAKSTAA